MRKGKLTNTNRSKRILQELLKLKRVNKKKVIRNAPNVKNVKINFTTSLQLTKVKSSLYTKNLKIGIKKC